ncbi:MAG: hypothetical protein RL238_903 [Actinomycetota bacterium]|jgi:PAS domain S-box-containing protein
MATLVALLAFTVAALYVVIAVVVVPRLAAVAAADTGRRSKAITAAAVGAATFLLGCSVTHVVIGIRELGVEHGHMEDWQALAGHVIPHILQIAGGITFLVVARRRLSVIVVRKDDSERIAELEGRLTHVLDAGHLGVWEHDLHTGVTWTSAQHDRILGHDTPPVDWNFERMLDQVIPDHRDLVRSLVDLTGERPVSELDCQVELPDGRRRWVTVTAALVFDDTGNPIRVVGTVADTTERHERDVQRATLEDQLHTWQRTEAVGRLASGVAHDFNNVLGVVGGWAELLERDESLSPRAKEQVAAIRRAAAHGRTLTQQLVAVNRHQADTPRPVDVNEVVLTVGDMIERLIPATIRVHRELGDDLPMVSIGPTEMTQVVLNLAINARDAMPAGGDLTLTTRAEAGRVIVDVTDTGIGMDADTLDRIFEPFFTTKSASTDSGTGLGLSICQSIATRAGGTIRARSAVGDGTTFSLELAAEPV